MKGNGVIWRNKQNKPGLKKGRDVKLLLLVRGRARNEKQVAYFFAGIIVGALIFSSANAIAAQPIKLVLNGVE
jgi:hypothetical protein